MKFVVYSAPGRTGGIEALHQLCDMLNSEGAQASIKYVEEKAGQLLPVETSECFYKDRYPRLCICNDSAPDPDSIAVIPEVWALHALPMAAASNVLIWWLSVDNGLLALGQLRMRIDHLRSHPKIYHAYQSEYAKHFLGALGFRSVDLPLSDYINIPVDAEVKSYTYQPAEKLQVCYNPLKGSWLAHAFVTEHPEISATPLINMTSEEIARTLRDSHAYIDFGFLPGKDRFPREAVKQGTPVFLRRSGDGSYPIDWEFPEAFYFSTHQCFDGNFLQRLLSLRKGDPASSSPDLMSWEPARQKVDHEKAVFQKEVKDLIGKLSDLQDPSNANKEIAHLLDNAHFYVDELSRVTKELFAIQNSTSWRLTAPIRKAVGSLSSLRTGIGNALKN